VSRFTDCDQAQLSARFTRIILDFLQSLSVNASHYYYLFLFSRFTIVLRDVSIHCSFDQQLQTLTHTRLKAGLSASGTHMMDVSGAVSSSTLIASDSFHRQEEELHSVCKVYEFEFS
jgi:hypothetical protein